MASFWDRIAAGNPPQQPTAPPPVPQQPSIPSGAWWKPETPPAPQQQPQAQPQMVPVYNPQGQVVGYTQVAIPQSIEMPSGDDPNDPHLQAALKLAKSAKSTDRCPNCNSGNYISVKAHGTYAERCFDCGHNPLFDQQAAGMPTDPGTATQAARQAGTDQNNFNPKTFDPAQGGAGVVRL